MSFLMVAFKLSESAHIPGYLGNTEKRYAQHANTVTSLWVDTVQHEIEALIILRLCYQQDKQLYTVYHVNGVCLINC